MIPPMPQEGNGRLQHKLLKMGAYISNKTNKREYGMGPGCDTIRGVACWKGSGSSGAR